MVQLKGATVNIEIGDRVKAMALFGLPAVEARVLDLNGPEVGIVITEEGDHYDKVTTVGLAQVVGTPEYEERNG